MQFPFKSQQLHYVPIDDSVIVFKKQCGTFLEIDGLAAIVWLDGLERNIDLETIITAIEAAYDCHGLDIRKLALEACEMLHMNDLIIPCSINHTVIMNVK